MSFSSVVISVLLVCYISWASVIPNQKIVESENSQMFKVHIVERGTKFTEKIQIDEEKELEYFHVPPHNGLTEADYLYDFKSDMTVTRVKADAKCYLGPLPDSLPKPADLKAGLQTVSQTPPSEHRVIERKYWTVAERVDKSLLRREVQDFCGHYPAYRLEEVDVNSIPELSEINLGRTRLARDLVSANLSGLPFCEENPVPSRKPNGDPACKPMDLLFNFEIRESHCTWWLVCKFSKELKAVACEEWSHKYNSMICYTLRCP